MLKKKSNILFFILLLVFSLGLLSTSYAVTFNDIENYLNQYKINKENEESIYVYADYKTAVDRVYNIYTGSLWNNSAWAEIKNYIESTNGLYNYVYFYSDYYTWIHFFCFENKPIITLSNNKINIDKNGWAIDYRFNWNNGQVNKERFQNSNISDSIGKDRQFYCFFNNDNFNFDWSNIQGQNLYATIKSTNYNGLTSTQNIAEQNNNVIFNILLGQNWDSSKVICKLIYYNDNNEKIVAPVNSENFTQNGIMQAVFSANTLDLTKSYACEVYYNNYYVSRSYNVQLISEGGNNNNSGAWKSGENLGVITNESGEKTGNIDLTPIIQGMGEINDNIVSGNQAIVNALTDTTLESGDEPTLEDIPKIEVVDVTQDFFTWLLNNIIGILNNNNDTYIDIPVYGQKATERVYSDVFIMNIEPLKTFIGLGWWFVCGVPFLKFIRRTIEKVKGGEVPQSDDKSDLLGHVL